MYMYMYMCICTCTCTCSCLQSKAIVDSARTRNTGGVDGLITMVYVHVNTCIVCIYMYMYVHLCVYVHSFGTYTCMTCIDVHILMV